MIPSDVKNNIFDIKNQSLIFCKVTPTNSFPIALRCSPVTCLNKPLTAAVISTKDA